MQKNTRVEESVTVDNMLLEEVQELVYQGSKVRTHGYSEREIHVRICKAT